MIRALAFALALAVPGAAFADTTVYVVRHAEKTADKDDPKLTAVGQTRAKTLASVLRSVPLAAVYTTSYRRNRETAAPAAKEAGLRPIVVKDAKDTDALAKTIKKDHAGQSVLVVGHSNTVPEMLKSLGVETALTLDEGDYDNLFVVHVGPAGATLSHLHFGAVNHSGSGKRKTR